MKTLLQKLDDCEGFNMKIDRTKIYGLTAQEIIEKNLDRYNYLDGKESYFEDILSEEEIRKLFPNQYILEEVVEREPNWRYRVLYYNCDEIFVRMKSMLTGVKNRLESKNEVVIFETFEEEVLQQEIIGEEARKKKEEERRANLKIDTTKVYGVPTMEILDNDLDYRDFLTNEKFEFEDILYEDEIRELFPNQYLVVEMINYREPGYFDGYKILYYKCDSKFSHNKADELDAECHKKFGECWHNRIKSFKSFDGLLDNCILSVWPAYM